MSDEQEMGESVMADLRRAFRPEFLNRLDETIIFHRLDRAQAREIVGIQLRRFEERLRDRDMHLLLSDDAKDLLANLGFDPTHGARRG